MADEQQIIEFLIDMLEEHLHQVRALRAVIVAHATYAEWRVEDALNDEISREAVRQEFARFRAALLLALEGKLPLAQLLVSYPKVYIDRKHS